MRIVCSNCGTSYRIKDEKLTRKVNRATCRKCKSVILIKKEDPPVGDDGVPGDDEDVDDEPTVDRSTFEQREADTVDGTEDDGAPTALMRKEDLEKMLGEHGDEVPGGDDDAKPDASSSLARSFPPPQQAPKRPAPSPVAPPVGTPMPMKSHDPSGDMKVAFAGATIAVLGVLILALSGDGAAHVVGLFAALWGAALAAVVLVTSGFGTKHGSLVGAFVLSLIFAGGATGIVAMLVPETAPTPYKEVAEGETEAAEAEEAAEAPEADEAGSDEGEEEAAAAEEPEAGKAKAEAPAAEERREEVAAVTPEATPDRLRPSGSGTDLATGSGSTPDRTPQPAETAPEPSSPVSAPDEPEVVPTSQAGATGRDSVDRTEFEDKMNGSSGIKRCLYKYRSEFGSMPTGRIPVTVRINPDGSVSSARITGGEYQGTSLDTCFGSSIRSLTFSAFDGPTAVESYTFTL